MDMISQEQYYAYGLHNSKIAHKQGAKAAQQKINQYHRTGAHHFNF
jgi:hypothetical protein